MASADKNQAFFVDVLLTAKKSVSKHTMKRFLKGLDISREKASNKKE